MSLKNNIYKFSLTAAILWTILIFILCATPGQYIPTANWLELLSFDKFVHAFLFFVLTTLWLFVAIKQQRSTITRVFYFLAVIAYGALLEFMQATCFSNRSADWKDIIANSFGCIMAVIFLKKLQAFFVTEK